MSRTRAGLPTVAAFSLVVPMLATPAAAAPVDAPQLPIQPPQYLSPPDLDPPWLMAGVNMTASPVEDEYDLYGFEQEDAGDLTQTTAPVVGNDLGQVQPSFSPDGSQVVFSAQQPAPDPDDPSAPAGPAWALMIGDVAPAGDGPGVSNIQLLDYPTVGGAADYQPAWSPDGEHIAFVREFGEDDPRADDGPQVQILDLDSRTLTEITLPPDDPGIDYRWTNSPTWAPDGSGLIVVGSVGTSTGTAFAPVDPDLSGTGSLWYYERANQSVHHLIETEPGCTDEPCSSAVLAGSVAWSPADPTSVAFSPWFGGGVSLLTLPDDLPTDGTADVDLVGEAGPLLDGSELPQYQDLAWDPDGSAVYATESNYPQILRIDPAGGSTVVFEDTTNFPYLLGLAYQPYSNLSISLEVPESVQINTPLTMTAEVTNAGPSPSRPGQVQVDVDYNEAPDAVPAGCELTGIQLHCTVDIDGLDVDESTQVQITVPAGDHMAVPSVTGVVTSGSPERSTDADNWTSSSFLTLDDPSLTTDAHSQRISFSMDRLHTEGINNRWSEDLAQSFTQPGGGTVEDSYRVLADAQLEEETGPDGETVPGPLQVDERDIDYSPDGSQAVFTRAVASPEEGSPLLSSELWTADVVGTQQPDLGEPGDLINLSRVATDPGDCDGPFFDSQPAWSRSLGETIAFVRSCGTGEDASPGRVMLLDLATGSVDSPFAAGSPQVDPESVMSNPTWHFDDTLIYTSELAGSDYPHTLWIVPLNTGIPHQLQLPDDASVCWPGTDRCDGPLTAQQSAWSLDGSTVAFTDRDEDGSVVFLATLPPNPVDQAIQLDPGEGLPIVGLRALDSFYVGSDAADADLWYPTWSPDGTHVAVVPMQESSPREILAADVTTGQVSTLFTGYFGSWLHAPEYEPYFDASVELDIDNTVRTGAASTLTLTIDTFGPSPSRDAIATLTLPDGVQAGTLPAECESSDTSTITCTYVGPSWDDHYPELHIPITTSADGTYQLTATVVTNAVDPVAGNNDATITVTSITPVSERIAFSMERPGDPDVDAVNSGSLDLVRSSTTDPGDPAATDYTVLAAGVLDQVTDLSDEAPFGPLLATDDNLDYSPDGSRAVFNRSADTQYTYTDDQRLVLADVVGTRQSDLGEYGDLINLSEVADSPGALPGDPEGPNRVSDTEPVFSPDGTQIAFVRTLAQGDNFGVGQVTLMNSDGTGMTSPFDPTWLAETGTGLDMGSPTWSPDGDALVFSAQGDFDDVPYLWYLPLDTGLPHQLALPDDGSVCWPGYDGEWCEGEVQGWQPAWAPQGGQIAFEYFASGGVGIAVLTVDEDAIGAGGGTGASDTPPITALTVVDAFVPDGPDFPPVANPAWSPEGGRIAVAQGGSDYVSEIVAATLATGETSTMFRASDVGTDLEHPEFEPYSDVSVLIARPSDTITTGTATSVTFTVGNNGPSPARDATLTVTLPAATSAGALPSGCTATGQILTCELTGPIPAGAEIDVLIPVTFTDPGDHRITATVATNSIDPEVSNDSARRTFTAITPTATAADVRVQLALDADRAWLGGDGLPAHITVTNRGAAPASNVQLTTTLPDTVLVLDAGTCPLTGGCDLGTLASGDQVSVDVLLLPTAVGPAEVSVAASTTSPDSRPGNNSDTASFEGVQAQLRLLPSVAEPGEVTLLYGVDLPPDAEITVRWSQGISTVYRPVAANDDGTLRTSVLVVDGDELGLRTMEVTSVAGTTFGLETPPTLLVVPRSMEPPDFLGRS